jgi:AbrB family looped-hinge helix DNA binding protein
MANSKESTPRKISDLTGVYRARITSKGQVTIPAAVREQVGLRPGDEITFEPKTMRFAPVPRPKLSELYGIFAPHQPTRSWSREREQAEVADAAARYDAAKTARIMKRIKK